MNKEEDKCTKLGETCYDFTGLWCDDCVWRQKVELLEGLREEHAHKGCSNCPDKTSEWGEGYNDAIDEFNAKLNKILCKTK